MNAKEKNELKEVNDEVPINNHSSSKNELIPDNNFLDYCQNIMNSVESSKEQSMRHFRLLFDQIINEGDATTSTKEMATAFFEKQFKANDQMIKILELWSKFKLKELQGTQTKTNIKNQQNNIFNTSKRDLMDITDNIVMENENE